MKIGVDAGCLGIIDERLKVGVYIVVSNMLLELSKLDKKNDYYLYSFNPIDFSLMKKLGNNMHNIVVRPVTGWLKLGLPLRLLFDKVDIFIAANQAAPLRLPSLHYKVLGIFYDIAFEKYPELYSYAASVEKHKQNSRNLAETADKLIAISRCTKNDIQHIYGVDPRKTIVAYPGIETIENAPAFFNNRPYFLFVGAFKKSKNIPFLIKGFVEFLKRKNINYDLLLVGGDKWMDPKIKEVINVLPKKYADHIKIIGFVDSHKLASLYRGAYAFVSPSLYEGFGLPFLEAQSVGIPVIGSFSGSLQEIIDKSGILINPKNMKMLVGALVSLSSNKSLYKKLVQRGKTNAKKYTWKSFAKQIQFTLESLA